MTKETRQSDGLTSDLSAELDPCDNKAHIMRVYRSSDFR